MVKKKIESLKKNSFAKSIIELKLLSDRIIESRSSSSFTIKYQMLYLIMENGKTSPQQLILDLNMAKSNLALLAKKMIKEGLITQVKDEGNKKQIYYVLLEKGEKELLSKMEDINKLKDNDKEMLSNLAKTIDSLKQIK